ncbi:hypothetical protein D9M68_923510 [compost metagenome]
MQPANRLELGHEVEEFAGNDGLPRKHDTAALVSRLAQHHQVVRQLGAVFHTVPGFKPSHGFRNQCIKK